MASGSASLNCTLWPVRPVPTLAFYAAISLNLPWMFDRMSCSFSASTSLSYTSSLLSSRSASRMNLCSVYVFTLLSTKASFNTRAVSVSFSSYTLASFEPSLAPSCSSSSSLSSPISSSSSSSSSLIPLELIAEMERL